MSSVKHRIGFGGSAGANNVTVAVLEEQDYQFSFDSDEITFDDTTRKYDESYILPFTFDSEIITFDTTDKNFNEE